MENRSILIGRNALDTIVKPKSFILRDIPAGSEFQHCWDKSSDSQEEDVDFDIVEDKFKGKVYPSLFFTCSGMGRFKLNLFDIRNFTFQGLDLDTYTLNADLTKDLQIQATFKVISCKPLIRNGEKVYPYFAYAGYPTYELEKAKLAKGERATEDVVKALKSSGIDPEKVDKYYRIIDIDHPLVYTEGMMINPPTQPLTPRQQAALDKKANK
jgi:hypothetical protein